MMKMVMPTATPLQQELTSVQKLPILLKKAEEIGICKRLFCHRKSRPEKCYGNKDRYITSQ
jgi:hypothetical protein